MCYAYRARIKNSTPWGIGLPNLIQLTRRFRGRNTIKVSGEHQKAIQPGDEVEITPFLLVAIKRGDKLVAKLLVPEHNFV